MTIQKRYQGLQNILKDCYNGGCHFLTLLTFIEQYNQKPVDFIDCIRIAQTRNWFDYSFEGKDALSFLNYYTGKKWNRTTVSEIPEEVKPNQYIEIVWYNPRTKYEHFRPLDFDVLDNSVTVKEGYIEKVYIYTVED